MSSEEAVSHKLLAVSQKEVRFPLSAIRFRLQINRLCCNFVLLFSRSRAQLYPG